MRSLIVSENEQSEFISVCTLASFNFTQRRRNFNDFAARIQPEEDFKSFTLLADFITGAVTTKRLFSLRQTKYCAF